MKFPSENEYILDVHNIDENISSMNYLFSMTNGDSKCRIIECRGRIKKKVLDLKSSVLAKICRINECHINEVRL